MSKYGGAVHVQKHYHSEVELFKKILPEQNWKDTINRWSENTKKMYNTTFVFSTCEVIEREHPRDNLYMWGHYGNGHRGVAIEFDATILANSFKKQTPSQWWKMEYRDEISKIKCGDIIEFLKYDEDENMWRNSKLYKVIDERLRTKSNIWEKEKEWRLAWQNDETTLKFCRHNLPDNAITAVYLGCRTTEQVRNDIACETRRNFPNANIFLAKMRKGEYELEFAPYPDRMPVICR